MKWFLIGVLMVVMLAVSMESAKAEQSVSLMLASKHINAPDCIKYGTETPCTWNERNIGIAYSYDLAKKTSNITPQAAFGVYRNSFNRLSTHIGLGYRLKHGGVLISAITGYPMLLVMPSLLTYVDMPVTKKLGVQLLMPYMPGAVQAVALQVRYRL